MEMYIPCNVGSQRRRQIQLSLHSHIDALPVLHCAFVRFALRSSTSCLAPVLGMLLWLWERKEFRSIPLTNVMTITLMGALEDRFVSIRLQVLLFERWTA